MFCRFCHCVSLRPNGSTTSSAPAMLPCDVAFTGILALKSSIAVVSSDCRMAKMNCRFCRFWFSRAASAAAFSFCLNIGQSALLGKYWLRGLNCLLSASLSRYPFVEAVDCIISVNRCIHSFVRLSGSDNPSRRLTDLATSLGFCSVCWSLLSCCSTLVALGSAAWLKEEVSSNRDNAGSIWFRMEATLIDVLGDAMLTANRFTDFMEFVAFFDDCRFWAVQKPEASD